MAMGRVAAWLLAWAALASPALAEPRLAIAPGTPVETVFRWAEQRCMEMHVPDSPARALRTDDGGVALFAAHLVNIPMLGRDFDHLAPVCGALSRGAEADDPAVFHDRFWIQAVVPFIAGGRRQVLGLASHEYMGWRHPGRCTVPFEGGGRRPAAFRCWYSAITATVATPGDWRFAPVPGPAAVIAASPLPYDPTTPARTGFFSVSNALVADGHATVLVYTEGVAGQRRGNCLLRAPLDLLPGGWRALSAGQFDLTLSGAYAGGAAPARACDVVGDAVFGGAPVRGLLRGEDGDGPWWAAVFTRAAPRGGAAQSERSGEASASHGVFVSISRDLRRWSPAERLWAMTPFRSQPAAGAYYEYPSLLDHASASPVFDSVATAPGSARLHLYLTRLNLEDRRRGLDRDLVRVAVTIENR
ncbi:hypothetical protein [Plastoroseomonas arctica]|uniref:Uncharacterized protein n=1 Tax=Plastoroseomonas arctica TaxID=1509237 RepID=A0AAF1KNX8_9PROT|nr:hypothetical protein [Plastoroseomonas arctica]MBR0656774.1 hypothetical protein [Plastoroseomonas arctica]